MNYEGVTLFAAAVALIGMTSCSKDYECSCSGDYSYDFGDGITTSGTIPVETYTIEDTDEDEASSQCQGTEDEIRSGYEAPDAEESDINVNCSVNEVD